MKKVLAVHLSVLVLLLVSVYLVHPAIAELVRRPPEFHPPISIEEKVPPSLTPPLPESELTHIVFPVS